MEAACKAVSGNLSSQNVFTYYASLRAENDICARKIKYALELAAAKIKPVYVCISPNSCSLCPTPHTQLTSIENSLAVQAGGVVPSADPAGVKRLSRAVPDNPYDVPVAILLLYVERCKVPAQARFCATALKQSRKSYLFIHRMHIQPYANIEY